MCDASSVKRNPEVSNNIDGPDEGGPAPPTSADVLIIIAIMFIISLFYYLTLMSNHLLAVESYCNIITPLATMVIFAPVEQVILLVVVEFVSS